MVNTEFFEVAEELLETWDKFLEALLICLDPAQTPDKSQEVEHVRVE